MPAVSVIVPARDSAATLPVTLDALAAQRLPEPFEVIVVDNGSDDGTADLAEAHPVVTQVIRRRRGEGPAAARNEGARAAQASILAFTDADCRPTPEWLSAACEAIEGVDLVQGRVLPFPEAVRQPFDRTVAVGWEYGLYETANIVVRSEAFQALGGFVELGGVGAAGRPFGEDSLFGWRLRRDGGRTKFSAGTIVHHQVFPGSARDHIAERTRLELFPLLAANVPELRDAFFFRRLFLSKRTAALDLALGGMSFAAATRSRWPVLAAVPYCVITGRQARRYGRGQAVKVAAVGVAADVVGLAALLRGSVRARTPLL